MTTLQAVADRAIDAAKAARDRAEALYGEVATRAESALDDARRRVEDVAENVESALQSRIDAARVGLGGRIRQ